MRNNNLMSSEPGTKVLTNFVAAGVLPGVTVGGGGSDQAGHQHNPRPHHHNAPERGDKISTLVHTHIDGKP